MSTAGLAGKLSPREEDRYETVENAQDGLGNGSHTPADLGVCQPRSLQANRECMTVGHPAGLSACDVDPVAGFWALMALGQITMRRVDGWQTLDQAPVEQPLDLAA